MSNWEYKVISSGKGGFASPALMEKFLNDLGQEHWEILSFQTQADNALAFTGLARRSTQRDWTLEDAAAAAARAEADKLRSEFEAKFRAATARNDAPAAADTAVAFLAEEKAEAPGGLRRLRDTSRDDDPDAPEDEQAPKDEWDQLAAEDELPTFFDALRPHMRRNQRGPGMSVGVDYLAKKWRLEEADLKVALVECGMQIPADENARPVFVEYEGDLYWVNINRRGEIWINTREKPQPVFRIVPGKRVVEEHPAAASVGDAAADDGPAARDAAPPATAAAPAAARPRSREVAPPEQSDHRRPAEPALRGAETLLDKIRSLMRRNRRGHGWSGSFPFLTKALRTDTDALLAQLAALGVTLPPEGSEKPLFHEAGEFLYWMNRNQRGEIWINARQERASSHGQTPAGEFDDEQSDDARDNPSAPSADSPTHASAPEVAPVAASVPPPAPPPPGPDHHTLAAVRLLLQPKKRGEGVAAQVPDLAAQLGQPVASLIAALQAAGVTEPADAAAKPTFGEHGGEIFWLNRNARDELWLNAKPQKATTRRPRTRRKPDDPAAG